MDLVTRLRVLVSLLGAWGHGHLKAKMDMRFLLVCIYHCPMKALALAPCLEGLPEIITVAYMTSGFEHGLVSIHSVFLRTCYLSICLLVLVASDTNYG